MSDTTIKRLSWRKPVLLWASLAWLCAGPLHPVALCAAARQALNPYYLFYWDDVLMWYLPLACASSAFAAIALLACLGSNPARSRLTVTFAAIVAIPPVILFVAISGSSSSAGLGNPSSGPPVGIAIFAAGAWAIASLVTSTISYFVIRYVAFRAQTFASAASSSVTENLAFETGVDSATPPPAQPVPSASA